MNSRGRRQSGKASTRCPGKPRVRNTPLGTLGMQALRSSFDHEPYDGLLYEVHTLSERFGSINQVATWSPSHKFTIDLALVHSFA